MATTPNFSWVTPAPTDFVTDLPADFETFADDVDADVWAIKGTADAALPETIIDAAGDLIYGSAADTAARLAIGTAGQVLAVNSGATAPQWVNLAGGFSPQYILENRNLYYRASTAGTAAFTAIENQTDYTPIWLPDCTLDRIACRTSASFASGPATVRLGIYQNAADNKPGNLLLDAGTVSATAANTAFEITISQVITEGIYWLAFNTQSTAGTNSFFGRNNNLGNANPLIGAGESSPNANLIAGFTQSGVTGAFANAGTLTAAVSVALAWVRIP